MTFHSYNIEDAAPKKARRGPLVGAVASVWIGNGLVNGMQLVEESRRLSRERLLQPLPIRFVDGGANG